MTLLRRIIFWTVFFLILWIAASLIALNKEIVNLDTLFVKIDVKLGLALLASFAVGWLFGIMSMLIPLMKSANKVRKNKKELKSKEKEVENLRQLPMSDSNAL